ncbi:MAG: beta-carotene 15,15'-dioxygenase, Brp/Blh family [bacterium]|jgi:lycopene beta-cyclase
MSQKFDYLFAGAGASTTLLLMSMEKRGMLNNKSIAIIDPDDKTKNDKTYCFWAKTDDDITIACNHLISYRWNKIIVNQNIEESIQPLEYLHITGQDVYNELKRIIHQYNIHRVHDSADLIQNNTDFISIQSNKTNNLYYSNLVFDSRTPKYQISSINQYQLYQSFIGYVIETENKIPLQESVRLMDFEVDQQNFTQFMYMLPFNSNKALVELTRFGSAIITEKEAEHILNHYIQENIGNYKITNLEIGCIPMSNAEIINENIKNVIPIGARAGAIKASTGYAFKKMFKHAEQIAESIYKEEKNVKIRSENKFKFYDRLLLQILNNQPEKGKKIFQTLFQKNKAIDVLHFIEEKTNLAQDVKILLSLPIKPFINALIFDTINKLKLYTYPLILLLFTLTLLLLKVESSQSFNLFQILFFGAGLFLVGIPHGALDNIVISGNINEKIRISFIIKYLSIAFIYFILWMFAPSIALIFFLIYSAWHFGQSDMQEWFPKNNKAFQNIAWGVMLLSIILLGHINETNEILSIMNTINIPLDNSTGYTVAIISTIISLCWAVYRSKTAMILSIVTLFISLYLPLLTSFAIYFIGQHSITGWSHLKSSLKADNFLLFKKALPFNLGAWFLMILLTLNINNLWLGTFFILISCISLPHVFIMNRFYNKL